MRMILIAMTSLIAAECGGVATEAPTASQLPAATAAATAPTTTATPTGAGSTTSASPSATATQPGETPSQPEAPPTAAPGTGYGESLVLVQCTVAASSLPVTQVSFNEDGTFRHIAANGIPDHSVGKFPNPGNPNTIAPQSYAYKVPLTPAGAGQAASMGPWGIGVNGVVFDPGAAEYYGGDRNSGWQYEALAGTINLGVDCNYAHVQPNGAYHYHGMPEGILARAAQAMIFVGWAGDGAPVYGRFGHSDPNDAQSPVRAMVSSYRLKDGERPSGPGGPYDGTFVEDYEYVEGLGDLDACNGRIAATDDFGRVYHYYITDNFPFIPRCFHTTPDSSFIRMGPPPGGGPPTGRAAYPPRRR